MLLSWRREQANLGDDVEIVKSAVVGERIVVIGRAFDDGLDDYVAAIWWEDEDLVWRRATLPETCGACLTDMVAGGPGIVAVGGHGLPGTGFVWTSRDGVTWSEAHLENGERIVGLQRVAAAIDGLVAFGWEQPDETPSYEPVAYVSHDGGSWKRAGNRSTHELFGADLADSESQLIGSGANLTALVSRLRQPVSVWRATGRDDWHKVGELPDSRRIDLDAAAAGPAGWVALGSSARQRRAWTSPDGISWRQAENAPEPVQAVFADRTGFIAVGWHDPVGGCAGDSTNWRNLTWTSVDGRIWRLVDEMGGGAHIESLRRRGRTLIGIGMIGEYEGALWTARLPQDRPAEGPLPTPVELQGGAGCGP